MMMDTENLLRGAVDRIASVATDLMDLAESLEAVCMAIREAYGLPVTDNTDNEDDGQLSLFDLDTLSQPPPESA